MHLSVAGKPVVNVQVQLQPTHVMMGQILWQGAPRPATAAGRVVLRDTRTGIDSITASQAIAADGSFRIDGLVPGHYYLGVQQLLSDWSLKSVTIAGRDVTDLPFDFDGAGDVDEVLVELTNRSSELSGTVSDADARPAVDYTVVAFAADARFWAPFSRRIQASQSSQDGRFVMRGLPAGDYLLVALDDVEPGAWVEPAFLETLRANAQRAHLGEAEHKTQDLRVRR